MSALAGLASVALRLLAQISVAVSAPATVAPREPALVSVEVRAPAGREVRLVPPAFAPFTVRSTTRVGGAVSAAPGARRAAWQVVEWRYVLEAPGGRDGRHDFAPFVAEVTAPGVRPGGARSRPWAIEVRTPAASVAAAGTAAGGSPDGAAAPAAALDWTPRPSAQGIAFHARVRPDTVYVGQQASYEIAVFLDDEVRQRLRRNPEFVPPELRGLLAYDLPAGRRSLRGRVVAGRRYDVHVFERAVFPLSAGRIEIPPAQLNYLLPQSTGFFSREESYTARSEARTLVAVDPPAAGRPADWRGAVGALRATARLDTARARVGDPLVLTLRVEGRANVKLLPRPSLALAWASVVPGEERVTLDSTSLAVRGAKEFDWILTPRAAGTQATPALRYPYFDPAREAYDVAVAEPVAVTVAPGALVAGDPATGATAGRALPIRRVLGADVPLPLPSRAAFWLLVAAAPAPAMLVLAGHAARARRGRRAGPAAARRLRALTRDLARDASAGAAGAAATVRRGFVAAVRERLPLDVGAFADGPTLARRLRRCGVTAEGAAEAAAVLAALDAAAFAAGSRTGGRPEPVSASPDARLDAALAARAWAVYERLDAEGCAPAGAAPRGGRVAGTAGAARLLLVALAGGGALLAVAAGAGGAGATQGPTLVVEQRPRGDEPPPLDTTARAAGVRADSAFAAGVRAYDAARWTDAARAFRAASAARPRAADAWANAGTAAWMAADTVDAALAWQRALRLAPGAADVRERLELLPAAHGGWTAGVPPLSPDAAAIAGAVLWGGASLLALVVAARARARPALRALRPAAWSAAATAGALLGTGALLADRAAARDLALVRAAGPLRLEPTLGADAAGVVEATDVARVQARHGVWTRVALDGGRRGWIEQDRVVPLALPDAE